MKILSEIRYRSMLAGGPGSGRHKEDLTPAKEGEYGFHGMTHSRINDVLENGIMPYRGDNSQGQEKPAAFATDSKSRALLYAQNSARNEARRTGNAIRPDSKIALAVIHPALWQEQEHREDDPEAFEGGIGPKYIKQIEIYRYGDVERNPYDVQPADIVTH